MAVPCPAGALVITICVCINQTHRGDGQERKLLIKQEGQEK